MNQSSVSSSSAPAGQSVLHNMMSVTNAQQRSISESSIVRSPLHPAVATLAPHHTSMGNLRNYSSSIHNSNTRYYDNRSTTFMMINRSGGSTVKAIIPAILDRCQAAATGPTYAPEEECYLLAQWAVDAFYKVVIASNGGIPALIRAMHRFPSHARLQESCCTALANLCASSEANQTAVERAGGVHQIIAAMKGHATSVAVQSAACEALGCISPKLVVQSVEDRLAVKCDLMHVLQNAKDMYLHPSHKRTAEYLLSVTVTNSIEATRRC